MKVLYVPEPSAGMPAAPVLVDPEEGIRALLEGLEPLLCYRGGERIPCPEGLLEDDLLVVGWAAGEAAAGLLGARFVEERRARLLLEEGGEFYESLARAAIEAASKPYLTEIAGGTLVTVVPGQVLGEKAVAVAVAADVEGRRPRLLAKALLGDDARPLKVASYTGLVERFGGFWQVPWESILSVGKSLRRLIEFVSERPVERLPSELLQGVKGERELAARAAEWAQSIEFEVYGRREVGRAVVYFEGRVLGLEGYVAALIQRNGYRRVRARWYFDGDFMLRGFDGIPPDAAPRIDADICVGRVPRECGLLLPQPLQRILPGLAASAPVPPLDYAAVKVLRWYEVALV